MRTTMSCGTLLLVSLCLAGRGEPADALGKATFSAVIDGIPVSGGAIDEMQQANAAYTIPRNGDALLLFWLKNTRNPDDYAPSHVLKFQVAKKLGAVAKPYIFLIIQLDKTHEGRYYSADANVTITSLTGSRVAGTFSGAFRNSPDTPNVPKKQISIADGKFDIPFATSKSIPE